MERWCAFFKVPDTVVIVIVHTLTSFSEEMYVFHSHQTFVALPNGTFRRVRSLVNI
jgi:hypothetical protein